MGAFVALLIIAAIALLIAGPVAVIMVLVLFSKVNNLERRLYRMEGRSKSEAEVKYHPLPVTKMPVAPPEPVQPEAAVPGFISMTEPEHNEPETEPATEPAVQETQPPQSVPVKAPVKASEIEPSDTVAVVGTIPVSKSKSSEKGGLELKIGTTVTLIVGVITVVFGVGFFLKYVIDHVTFSKEAKVIMVAVGGFVSLAAGEILRRKNYEVVARGIAAMGFALLYAAVFGGSWHEVFGVKAAFIMSILITAGAMAYAVGLNEVLIAFLALLGGYLSPIIISSGQNLPMPLFSYVLVLSVGTMGSAMFRRWRAVNWVAMVGTYLLYTAWFEKFYDGPQAAIALSWLSIFAVIYMVLPILNGFVKKLTARAEDVALVVANSVIVYYHFWRILYIDSQQGLALASAILGVAHIALVFVVLRRCREDIQLQAALGVLGSGFIAAAIPLYYDALQPTLVGWSIEAVVLTFIGIHYRSLWTKVMATIVSAIAAAGLFYHLPLHTEIEFRLVFNNAFGTWVWVSAAILLCHGLWRFMKNRDEDSEMMMQLYYIVGCVLLAVGCALEWFGWCDVNVYRSEAWFLMGLILFTVALIAAFVTRPVCPKGEFVRMAGVVSMVAGSAFTVIALIGIYDSSYGTHKLFLNVPALIAAVFTASVFYGAWQLQRTLPQTTSLLQLPGALRTMGTVLIMVLLSEQIYMYWYCRNEYGTPVANWQSIAYWYIFILWAISGAAMLYASIRFNKPVLKAIAIATSTLSAVGLFMHMPLHFGGDFRFVFNLPFMAWVCVATGLLIGHGLWRFIASSKDDQAIVGSQVYYAAGLILLAIGCLMEWYAHCEYQIQPDKLGSQMFVTGVIGLSSFLVLLFMTRPLPPESALIQGLGVLTMLGGGIWTAIVMNDVYYKPFMIFLNGPFVVVLLFIVSVLVGAWMVKDRREIIAGPIGLSSALVLGVLVLMWLVLSEQVYSFWQCKAVDNWKFIAQMYMSVMWAIYAAALMVIGFAARAPKVRYLSLTVFAVLLGKIFIIDTATLQTGYRIAAFITTGLILVGVSLLYQHLKKKGFFDAIEKQMLSNKDDNEQNCIN